MKYRIGLILLTLLAATLPGTASGQEGSQAAIRSALTAAPPEIARHAAVSDMNGNMLRSGTNGWTCYADDPNTPGPDPMCVDAPWTTWIDAWQHHATPRVDRVGVAYMLGGGSDASNTDPFATKPADGHAWITSGPHVMVVVPDMRLLESFPTDPTTGGPYVMWKGTPYAHVMVPVDTHAAMPMPN